jgi:hypothetical protein
MIFADILTFMIELSKGNQPEIESVEIFMLAAAIVTQVPIWMIFFSRTLKYKINRIANIIAGIFTIIYVVGPYLPELNSIKPHYAFIASVEVLCALIIITKAWKWKNSTEE